MRQMHRKQQKSYKGEIIHHHNCIA